MISHKELPTHKVDYICRMKIKKNISKNNNAQPSFRKYGWLVHASVWLVLCGFPVLMAFAGRTQQTLTWDFYVRFVIMLSSILVVFYLNYLLFVERFLFTKKMAFFILCNVVLIIGIIGLVHFAMELLPEPANRHERREHVSEGMMRLGFFLWNSMIYVFTIVVSVAFRATSSWHKVEAQRKELERSRTEAELQNLKSQLNPHFLFNTLNNIYSLIAFDTEKAQEAVHDLSRLLRYVMYDSSQPMVTLEKEMDFVRNYMELMRIRLPEHVRLETCIQLETPETLIAPLLCISLIENAFKHGVSNNKPSYIGIDIRQENKEVICNILNSYYPKNTDRDKSGSGIGLSNLEKRLSLLYPGKYQFTYGQEGDHYRSFLSITVK